LPAALAGDILIRSFRFHQQLSEVPVDEISVVQRLPRVIENLKAQRITWPLVCHPVEMGFDRSVYGADIAAILELDGGCERLLPLTREQYSSEEARRRLRVTSAAELFPGARAPEAAMSGLYLYFSCWEEAHAIAQDLSSAEGSFWHGIIHRQEPDAWNASYWFRRVGSHPIFPELYQRALPVLTTHLKPGGTWDPLHFVELCERAGSERGSELERQLMIVQRTEWQLLFDYCARPRFRRSAEPL
jgi:hypothetical protein